VIWVPMSDAQKMLYQMIIEDKVVREAVSKTDG
jgi:hypothetical protein